MDQQPSSQTPQPQSPPPYTPPPAPQSPQQAVVYQENPGQTLGVLSIVTAFLFSPVGIVLGVMSRKKSKQANLSSSLGTIGLVLSSIFTGLFVLSIALIFATTFFAYKGIEQGARDNEMRSQQIQLEQQKAAETQP